MTHENMFVFLACANVYCSFLSLLLTCFFAIEFSPIFSACGNSLMLQSCDATLFPVSNLQLSLFF